LVAGKVSYIDHNEAEWLTLVFTTTYYFVVHSSNAKLDFALSTLFQQGIYGSDLNNLVQTLQMGHIQTKDVGGFSKHALA
jgi:hypothetical protein